MKIIFLITDANTNNNFTCICMPDFEGPYCDVPFCETTPCQNGGLCIFADAYVSQIYATSEL